MLDKTKFDAIIFDLGGVILNIDYNLTIDAFKKLGGTNFDDLYRQAHQNEVFDRYETGQMSSDEFRAYLRSFLPEKVTNADVDHAWNSMLLDLPEERIKLLQQLSKSHRTFLFSNTNDIHYHVYRKGIEEKFGDIDTLENTLEKTYYSHLAGRRKPNAEAFELVLEENDIDPLRTLFIDDSIQHIEGAQKVGLQTHHLKESNIVDIFG